MSHTPATAAKIIPFNKPYLGAEEFQAITEVFESGNIGGNGKVGSNLSALLQQKFNLHRALLTTSCTHALEMAGMALDWGPGDEVILPSFAFVTAATAVVRQGATPIFAEIDEKTWNIDPADVERHITPRTRAIIPVHYAGQGCDMDALMAIAKKHDLDIVEDAAQGIGAKYNGEWLGTIGDIGAYSFHVTKNVICGEGGAFLTNREDIAQRAEIIMEKGTNRSQFLRGAAEKYSWVDIGSSYVVSDLLAAIARAQFAKMDEINRMRGVVWQRYQEGLADLADEGLLVLPYVHPKAEPNWHIYGFRIIEMERRATLFDFMDARGIKATFHFVPLHSSPYGLDNLGYKGDEFPITDRVSQSLIRLPLYPHLDPTDQDFIIETIHDFFRGN
ncbi:MAG: dTDP-4-amino-4,6-dideoxy-D-glucose transaminase [Chloroflexota bacterium]|nr:dTDP-4-amino-4,6-dideoxygalactose transaminase [Chloroflexota bacterium]NOG62025.1 dTDP-4-amino-4,6-dideoxygalactose transaminase [Chloroflexota bacterium]GIK62388.1 MAG: dTDP-4-amino-4,6-dideoxy-D-glucose transaminase [Chloroflexota bacterium]